MTVETDRGPVEQEILFPPNPGSIYHMTKTQDALLFQFYAKNDGVRITDLHQGIVWGTQTEETRRDERLINRFDYDGDYGTVLNRFLMQAAVGYPLTVHGSGGQTRAFIHIQDTVRCIELALENAPKPGDRVKILNQMTESRRVRDLAGMIAEMTGAEIAHVPNPRHEADENDLVVANDKFRDLGLKPITLAAGPAGRGDRRRPPLRRPRRSFQGAVRVALERRARTGGAGSDGGQRHPSRDAPGELIRLVPHSPCFRRRLSGRGHRAAR